MAQDDNEGVSYLMALRGTAAPQTRTGTAIAPAPETAVQERRAAGKPAGNPGTPYQGTDKRRSLRYRCHGSAEIREEGCEVRTWANFTDISLHGCYVEAQSNYPVGTRLQIRLDANGVRVDARGTVRVTYPHLGMGIAFKEDSPETREQLKQLLGTVVHSSLIMGPGVASALPSCGTLDAVPLISNPGSAIQALVEFFEGHHMLTREVFLRVLRKSQG